MSEKQNEQAHKDYIKSKGEFVVNCSHKVFNREEIELLQKYGHWFEALINGSLKPISKVQEDFLLQVKERKIKEYIQFNYTTFVVQYMLPQCRAHLL